MEVKSEYVTILFSHIYWNQKENFLSVWFGGYFNYGTVLKIFKNYIENTIDLKEYFLGTKKYGSTMKTNEKLLRWYGKIISIVKISKMPGALKIKGRSDSELTSLK